MTGIFAYSDNAVGDQKNKFALHDFTKIKESTGIPTMYFQNSSYHNKWAFDQAGGNFKMAYIHDAKALVHSKNRRLPKFPCLQPRCGIIDDALLTNIKNWGNKTWAKKLSDGSHTTLKRVTIPIPLLGSTLNNNISHPYPQSLANTLSPIPGTRSNYCFFTMDTDFVKYHELPCVCS